MSKSGIVKNWNDEKGFGFIATDDSSDDLFVHKSALQGGAKGLRSGDKVRYDPVIQVWKGQPMWAVNVSSGEASRDLDDSRRDDLDLVRENMACDHAQDHYQTLAPRKEQQWEGKTREEVGQGFRKVEVEMRCKRTSPHTQADFPKRKRMRMCLQLLRPRHCDQHHVAARRARKAIRKQHLQQNLQCH